MSTYLTSIQEKVAALDPKIRHSVEAGLFFFALVNPLTMGLVSMMLPERPWLVSLLLSVVYFVIVYVSMRRADDSSIGAAELVTQ